MSNLKKNKKRFSLFFKIRTKEKKIKKIKISTK